MFNQFALVVQRSGRNNRDQYSVLVGAALVVISVFLLSEPYLSCRLLFLCFGRSLLLYLSVYLALSNPAAHSSCMDHKPQQHNKLRLQRWWNPSSNFQTELHISISPRDSSLFIMKVVLNDK